MIRSPIPLRGDPGECPERRNDGGGDKKFVGNWRWGIKEEWDARACVTCERPGARQEGSAQSVAAAGTANQNGYAELLSKGAHGHAPGSTFGLRRGGPCL